MKKLARIFVSGLFLASFASEAAPRLDEQVERILRGSSQGVYRVALLFPEESGQNLLLNRRGRQWAMMRHAERSQAPVRAELQRRRVHGETLRFKSYWLINALVIEASPVTLRQIARSDQQVSAMVALGRMSILPHLQERPLRDGPTLTYGLEKIGMQVLKEKMPNLDGRGVRLGVLDTGIDESHPDLKGKVLAFKSFVESEEAPHDEHGHGTHVAGTMVGGESSGNRIGVAPGASLVVGQIFDENGSADEDQILDGMQWIADPDGDPNTDDAPRVVNNSWGNDLPGGDPRDKPTCRAVEGWMKLSILPVFAAGNFGPGSGLVSTPGACPGSLSVGATDKRDEIASFSSRGPAVWSTGTVMQPLLSAPGVKVLSSSLSGRYVMLSGTSMAAPHVAGVAALLLQAYPNMSPVELGRRLMDVSVDLGDQGQDPAYGFGRLETRGLF